jgi:uncharacterized protein DUF6600
MKRKLTALALVFVILIGFGISNRAEARTEVTLDVFYDALSPYGEWIEHEYYGYIWQPVGVDEYWKPYRDGNWQYSEEGWIWVSDEPWGWATYHYGRWVPDDYYGWIWIPGVDWAPAYVEWYDSPGYIGWSPRPPDTSFFLSIGIAVGSGYGYYSPYYYEPYYYGGYGYYKKHYGKHYRKKHRYGHRAPASHSTYVPDYSFSHKNAKLVALDRPHNLVVHRNSKNINNVKVQSNRIVNRGPDRLSIERRTGKKINRVNLVERDLVQVRGKREVNQLKGNQYNIYRPNVVKRGNEAPRKISKRHDERRNRQADNNTGLVNREERSSSKDTVVNRNSQGLRSDYNKSGVHKQGKRAEVKNNSRIEDSHLTPAKSNKQQINRNKISTQYQSSKHPQLGKNTGYKSQVNSSPGQNKYKSKPEGNKLRGNSDRNLVSPRNYNAKSIKNSRKPFKASNKSLSPTNSQKSKAAYKSQKPQVKSRSVNKGQRYQKSFKSNKANNHAKQRKVNNVHKGNFNKKATKRSTVRSAPNRNRIGSTVNKSFNSSRSTMRNSGKKSFNRQVRR